MSDWWTWGVPQWNERLLEHFFGRRGDRDLPVVALLATPEELARATGDRDANASEVRTAFVATVCAAIAHAGSLLQDASNYSAWPRAPQDDVVPRFVSHLIFTCIAASESSEGLANEGSFLARLRELTEDRLPDHSLQWLPRLWEHLAAWLGRNRDRYRELKLPDPGGLTRIGYTVKLAFPDRRDQRALSELLAGAGLSGQEPPVGKVISLVASSRSQFRRAFLDAFDDFRRRVDAGTLYSRGAAEHQFWSAVRDAAFRGRGVDEQKPESAARVQFLCEEQDDRLFPFLVTDEAMVAGAGLVTVELPVSFGRWRYAVLADGVETADASAVHAVIGALLRHELLLPRLSSLVTQGVLPLVEAAHGCLELAGQDDLEDAHVALVRHELASSLAKAYGQGRARISVSNFEGWDEVRGLRLRRLPSSDLEATPLSSCWVLHQSLLRAGIRLQGGLRTEDGWLGLREVLPKIVIAGAREAVLIGPSGLRHDLSRDDEGCWRLPNRDHVGEFEVEAMMDDGSSERCTIRFHGGVGSESFRSPDDRDAWMVESLSGTATLSAEHPLTATACDEAAPVIDPTAYLGPMVGQFVDGPDTAAWRVTRFAGKTRGARCRPELAETTGTARVDNGSARSKWRRLLLNCAADPMDPGFETARRKIRQRAMVQDLPKVAMETPAVIADGQGKVEAVPSVDRLLTVVSARAASRTGIGYGEWSNLVQGVLGVRKDRTAAITRSWAEAGMLDVASYVRWRQRCIFARPPIMVLFRTGGGFGATILGMLLPSTRKAVLTAASRSGVLVEQRAGISRFTPALMTLRADTCGPLEDICQKAGVGSAWLDVDVEGYGAQCRHDGFTQPPLNYEHRQRWSKWSLRSSSVWPEVTFEHCVRGDRPDYWEVRRGRQSVWSYDLNTARLWAAALAGEPAVVAGGDGELIAVHGYVPLPAARLLAVVAGAASGEDDGGQYRYLVRSPVLKDRILGLMQRTFHPGRLPAYEQAMTG